MNDPTITAAQLTAGTSTTPGNVTAKDIADFVNSKTNPVDGADFQAELATTSFPTAADGGGAVLQGMWWRFAGIGSGTITGIGLGPENVEDGDILVARVNNPGTDPANWSTVDAQGSNLPFELDVAASGARFVADGGGGFNVVIPASEHGKSANPSVKVENDLGGGSFQVVPVASFTRTAAGDLTIPFLSNTQAVKITIS